MVRDLSSGALLHTDAVQAPNWIDIATEAADYDLVSVTGHKVGSPVGTGALVVRDGVELDPLIVGGGQERGRRAGTPDVAGAVSFAAALGEATEQRDASVERLRVLRDGLIDGLIDRLGDRVVVSAAPNGDRSHIAAGIANVCIAGVQSEALLFLIDAQGVRASAASSCSSGAQDPSHVLAAMGIPRELAAGSLRLSLGHTTTARRGRAGHRDHRRCGGAARPLRRRLRCPDRRLQRPSAGASNGTGARRKILVAMSGGVDSSVAAALLLDAGHDVAGVTMKLWGGPSDTGCCSVSDVDDARWVADQLGIEHHVFNFGDDFERHIVAPYAADHAAGRTPNPCVECNRHIKFSRLLRRADALGFELVATGHHARIVEGAGGARIARGADAAKDQSYVLHMLDAAVLARLCLPVGEMTKSQVRAEAQARGLVTACQARQSGRLLHHLANGSSQLPRRAHRDAAGTAGRHVGATGRHSRGGGAAHCRPAPRPRRCWGWLAPL